MSGDDQTNMLEAQFKHVVLEGTAYDVGRRQAELIRDNPGAIQFLTHPFPPKGPLTTAEIDEAIGFFDKFNPCVNEEARGLAEGLGIKQELLTYYAFSYSFAGACSHLAVLPGVTADGHCYLARSYEWGTDDALTLYTTRIQGQAAHIGFTLLFLGRFDGMNEHGLCATMSAGAPGSPRVGAGVTFEAVIRAVLDRCQTVDEAIDLAQQMPISFNFNLLLADRTGRAARMEIAHAQRAVTRIGPDTPAQFVCAANHFVSPALKAFDTSHWKNSDERYNAIERRLNAAGKTVTRETIKDILSAHAPNGMCCHYYKEGMGTLWSEVFDATTGQAEIAFGSPACNPWRTFGLTEPAGATLYPAVFPDEVRADPDFFRPAQAIA